MSSYQVEMNYMMTNIKEGILREIDIKSESSEERACNLSANLSPLDKMPEYF